MFKSIAINGGAGNIEMEDEDFDEEEMPLPREGKDIDLGWDIEHMDQDDLRELKLRAQNLFKTDERPVILFDGVCNFCNAYVNTIIDIDPDAKFRFASL